MLNLNDITNKRLGNLIGKSSKIFTFLTANRYIWAQPRCRTLLTRSVSELQYEHQN